MTAPTVILLAGGFGTRIKSLHPDLPKPLIPVNGRPFLDWNLRYWRQQGVSRAVLSLGHLAEVAERYYAMHPPQDMEIRTVTETIPLGTGGAVLFAAGQGLSDPFFVGNGDSLVLADLKPAMEWMRRGADGVIVGVEAADAGRYGTLAVGPDGRLTGFAEKRPGAGVINAGIYVFRQRVFEEFPDRQPLSMETDVFPALLKAGADLRVAAVRAPFLDIGTPDSLGQAEAFIQTHFA